MFELGVKIDFQEVMPEEFMCKINLLKGYGQSPSNVQVFTESNHFSSQGMFLLEKVENCAGERI
jgi:hypothetical protein